PAPVAGGTKLFGYELANGQSRWTYQLPGADAFSSAQLRLASWKYDAALEPMTVALAFTQRAGAPTLVAIDARFGAEQWACPLGYSARTEPQAFELASGMMALMDGAATCGHCDPPFADSSASFHTFALSGVDVAREPWVGTFGGAGHG